jgi:CheY-like chemotaxis protein
MISKKILIVEDDHFTRFMMKKIIDTMDLGLSVDVAEDGAAGCERLENRPNDYALVLMDVHMPNLSGLDATKRIRANESDPPRQVPIIAVTADADYHHPLAVKEYGMDGFMAKPISPGGLVELLDKYCA